MNHYQAKTSYLRTSKGLAARVFGYAAVLAMAGIMLQPLGALADTTTITDSNNTQNPAQQTVTASSTDPNLPVITNTQYSTSTPDSAASTTPDSTASTTDPSLNSASSTPSNTSTSTDPGANNASSTPPGTATSTDPSAQNASTTPDTASSSTPDTTNPPVQPAIVNNGSDSSASSTTNSTTTVALLNTNDIIIKTISTSTADSGNNNTAAQSGDIRNATTTTGDVNVYANVLTVANINLVNSDIVEMNNNFNNLADDLYLNQPELSPGQRTQDIVSPICTSSGATCQSITTFKLTNKNTADLNNNVTLDASSGNNQVSTAKGDVRDSSIQTGNVNAVVNILNIVNANEVNSHWTIVTFNVFGDWTGDLVMPSEMYFSDLMNVGSNSNTDISQIQKVILDINNKNDATFTNNASTTAATGNNTLNAPTAGDVRDDSIVTGSSTAQSAVHNVGNITIYNSKWFLGLVNVMGDWTGNIYSLPDQVAVSYEPTGFMFVSSSDPAGQALLLSELNPPTPTSTPAAPPPASTTPAGTPSDTSTTTPPADAAPTNPSASSTDPSLTNASTTPDSTGTTTPDSTGSSTPSSAADPASQPLVDNSSSSNCVTGCDNSSTSTTQTTVQVDNSNQAKINNDVAINANTGGNGISAAGDVRNDSIKTGNATALANILNFANANLVNSDLQVGLVNIFGNWTGNIVFGYPELSVSQSTTQTQIPDQSGQSLPVTVNYANTGNASMSGTKLEYKYDPAAFTVSGAQDAYQQQGGGDIVFDLGKLAAGQNGSIGITLQTLPGITAGAQNQFFANIFGSGPQKSTKNNQSLIVVPTAGTPSGGSSSSGGNGGGGGGGGSSSSGGSSGASGGGGGGGNSGGGGGGGSSSGGGGGGGGGSSSSNAGPTAIGVYPDLLRVYKSNDAYAPLKPGDSVSFTIVVDNDGNNTVHSIVLHDTLLAPDGSNVSDKTYDVGDMLSRQEYTVKYTLALAANAGAGTYTNSAYAQGLDDSLKSVRNVITALSKFTVTDVGQGAFNPNNQLFQPQDLASSTASSTLPAVTVTVTPKDQGQVLGASCVRPVYLVSLQQGSRGDSVKLLQRYLNNHGFPLAKSGAGSPGNETAFFGPMLKAALVKFQQDHGLKERGIFGTETRNFLNNFINTSGSPFCQPPVAAAHAKSASKVVAPTASAKPAKPAAKAKPAKPTAAVSKDPVLAVNPSVGPAPADASAQQQDKPGFWKRVWSNLK